MYTHASHTIRVTMAQCRTTSPSHLRLSSHSHVYAGHTKVWLLQLAWETSAALPEPGCSKHLAMMTGQTPLCASDQGGGTRSDQGAYKTTCSPYITILTATAYVFSDNETRGAILTNPNGIEATRWSSSLEHNPCTSSITK